MLRVGALDSKCRCHSRNMRQKEPVREICVRRSYASRNPRDFVQPAVVVPIDNVLGVCGGMVV
jgi:hypothetical protein